jgi:hypothetical protein
MALWISLLAVAIALMSVFVALASNKKKKDGSSR